MIQAVEEANASDAIARLLDTLEVRLNGCSLCVVPHGVRDSFNPGNTLMMYYVLAGRGVIQTDDGQHAVTQNSVVIAPAGFQHRWEASSTDGGANHLSAEAGTSWCGPFNESWSRAPIGRPDRPLLLLKNEVTITNAGVPGLFDYLRAPIALNLADESVEQRLCQLLVSELELPGIGSPAMSEGLLRALLILVLRQRLRVSRFADAFALMCDPRLARAMTQILQKPADAHTVDTLAAAAGMSRTAFLDRFRKTFSQSPIEFLQGFRLKFAAHLLQTTPLPIKSVAVAVGYTSRSYFSRIFSMGYGTDPTAYRLASQAHRPPLVKSTALPKDLCV